MLKKGICIDCITIPELDEGLKLVKDLGFETVFSGDYDAEELDIRIKKSKEYGLYSETIHSPFSGINDMWKNEECGNVMLNKLISSVQKCDKYSIPTCVIHVSSGHFPPQVSDIGFERYEKLIREAKKYGVKLAFENLRKAGHLLVLLENYKYDDTVKMCYDCGHEFCYTKGISYVEMYPEKLECVHLHDNFGIPASLDIDGDLHYLPYDGKIDYSTVMKNLKNSGFKKSLMLEVNRNADIYQGMSLSEFLKKAYASVEKLAIEFDKA